MGIETGTDMSTDSSSSLAQQQQHQSTPANIGSSGNNGLATTSSHNPNNNNNHTQKARRNSLSRLASLRRNSMNSAHEDLSVLSDNEIINGALDDEAREVRGLARQETFKVQILRLIVALCIVGAGTVISVFTHRVLREKEEQDSRQSFQLLSTSMQSTIQARFADLAQATRDCSRLVTGDAMAHSYQFPLATLDQFELYAAQARERARIESVLYLPIIEHDSDLESFNDYMRQHEQEWVATAREIQDSMYPNNNDDTIENEPFTFEYAVFDVVNGEIVTTTENASSRAPFTPVWQWSPPPAGNTENTLPIGKQNFATLPHEASLMQASHNVNDFVLGRMHPEYQTMAIRLLGTKRHDTLHSSSTSVVNPDLESTPHAVFAQPIWSTSANDSVFDKNSIVGYLFGIVAMDAYLSKLLPAGVKGVTVVIRNSCDEEHSFWLAEDKAIYLGPGDLSAPDFRSRTVTFTIPGAQGASVDGNETEGYCIYTFALTPTQEFENLFDTDDTTFYTIIVAVIFAVTAFAFFIYDFIVQRRNSLVLQTAAKFNTIVSSLFPSNIRGRLFADKEKDYMEYTTAKSHLKNFLTKGDIDMNGDDEEDDDGLILKTKPMADLFTDTTIMFADIAGFTAWSSVREPSQVFILLETVYRSFDQIAKKRRVFKVETVGDCYVAVAGLPDPRDDHAVVMARFARECLASMNFLVKKLEVNLGPDTGDLGLRIGLHSGAVTAGVLRGERSRFQLFGDTMNTTARMESTGIRDRIQISQETANLLQQAGKNHWFEPRADTVVAKGKGALKTFWLRTQDRLEKRQRPSLPEEMRTSVIEKAAVDKLATEKTTRLIDWNCDVLLRLLKQIVARRKAMAKYKSQSIVVLHGLKSSRRASLSGSDHGLMDESNENGTVIDEVKEIITLPKLDLKLAKAQEDADGIDLDSEVVDQLNEYVSNIAAMYRENAFHNFEHASHVTMSVVKLLSRIVAPSDLVDDDLDKKKRGNRVSISFLHDHTYGITSDPLTQFACVLSALMHDADHPGVPNAQLIKEKTRIAVYYKNQSIAEQNSVDLCWDLLMDPRFKTLRETIYSNDVERRRFRQLVVNSVMATDIVDKELKALRNARWERAFREVTSGGGGGGGGGTTTTTSGDDTLDDYESTINRKATIVIEHLIQASDVAHTMQHWHIYRKWNERFFMECYKAYQDGRAEKDPSEGWYKGEIGFFDFYIIPLAKKLKDCGVFGVSSDEYLQYAQKNRAEWEIRGQEIVAGMMDKVAHHHHDNDSSNLLLLLDDGMSLSSQRKLSYDTSDDEMED